MRDVEIDVELKRFDKHAYLISTELHIGIFLYYELNFSKNYIPSDTFDIFIKISKTLRNIKV